MAASTAKACFLRLSPLVYSHSNSQASLRSGIADETRASPTSRNLYCFAYAVSKLARLKKRSKKEGLFIIGYLGFATRRHRKHKGETVKMVSLVLSVPSR